MTILNLKVKDLNRLVEFKEIYAFGSCCIPIFGIDNVVRCKISSIYPTLTLNLEGMRFGAADDFAVNIKLGQTVNTLM